MVGFLLWEEEVDSWMVALAHRPIDVKGGGGGVYSEKKG